MTHSSRARRSGLGRTVFLRVVPTVLGWLVIVALADLAVGLLVGRGDPPARPPDLLLDGPSSSVDPDHEIDQRIGVPAMGGVPWSEDYWAQFHSLEYEYVPFLYTWNADADLPYFKSENGIRHSYQQADLPADAPTIWFFGGSTMWGEGQRDEYTIPSYVARLAEEQGVPLRVVNYGSRGRAHWEEMIRFERALAEDPHPDVVVFYDGVNDLNVHNEAAGGIPSADPTRFRTAGEERDGVPPPLSAEDQVGTGTWYDSILERSLLLRLAGHLGLESPAAADDAPTSQEIVTRVLDIYERGRALSTALSERSGVRPVFFWQPYPANEVPGGPPSIVRSRLSPPTIDITRALDRVPVDSVYLDGAHTNERGAELVASAMMPYLLGPQGLGVSSSGP